MSGKLRDLIRAVRACKTAAQERETIAKECAALVRTPTHPHPHAQRHSQPTRCGQTASKLLARGSESVRSRGKVSAPWQSLGPFLGDFCDSVRCTWHCDWSAMPSSRDQSPTVCARLPEASKSGSEGKRALESPSPCALARRSTRAPPSRRRGCAQTVPRLPPSAPGGAKVSEARVQHPRALKLALRVKHASEALGAQSRAVCGSRCWR